MCLSIFSHRPNAHAPETYRFCRAMPARRATGDPNVPGSPRPRRTLSTARSGRAGSSPGTPTIGTGTPTRTSGKRTAPNRRFSTLRRYRNRNYEIEKFTGRVPVTFGHTDPVSFNHVTLCLGQTENSTK